MFSILIVQNILSSFSVLMLIACDPKAIPSVTILPFTLYLIIIYVIFLGKIGDWVSLCSLMQYGMTHLPLSLRWSSISSIFLYCCVWYRCLLGLTKWLGWDSPLDWPRWEYALLEYTQQCQLDAVQIFFAHPFKEPQPPLHWGSTVGLGEG